MPTIDEVKSREPLGRFAVDLTGQEFGRLAVTKWAGRDSKGDLLWWCKCECGNKTLVLGRSLNHGKTKSCGCLSRDVAIASNTKHNLSRTRIYHAWYAMIARCHDTRNDSYHNYGARGITVCKRWRASIEAFLDDMGMPPFDGATLERINNNKGYTRGNCRWADRKEQNANKRTNVSKVRYQGDTLSITELAERTGCTYALLYGRIVAMGWPVKRAVETPPYDSKGQSNKGSRQRVIKFRGKRRTITEWADELGVPYHVIHKRLRAGWSVKKALTTPPRQYRKRQ